MHVCIYVTYWKNLKKCDNFDELKNVKNLINVNYMIIFKSLKACHYFDDAKNVTKFDEKIR